MPESAGILVTGATGLVGLQLTRRLVRAGFVPYVMARGKAPGAAAVEAYNDAGLVKRVRADLNEPRLGLTTRELSELSQNVRVIVHCAGSYRLSGDYRTLRETNVAGFSRLLDLATAWGGPALHHVSSIVAAGDVRGVIDEGALARPSTFRNAYERSKWEAEQIALAYAGSKGTRIYRPGIIVGDSTTGEISKFDGPYEFFHLMLPQLPAIIGGPGVSAFPLITVDLVADALVAGIHHPPEGIEYVHMLDADRPTLREFAEAMSYHLLGHRRVVAVPCRALEFLAAIPGVSALSRIEREIIPYMRAAWEFKTERFDALCARSGLNANRMRRAYEGLAAFYALKHGRNFYPLT